MRKYISEFTFKVKVYTVNPNPEITIFGEVTPSIDNYKNSCLVTNVSYKADKELSVEDCEYWKKYIIEIVKKESFNLYYTKSPSVFDNNYCKHKSIKVSAIMDNEDIIINTGKSIYKLSELNNI